jgi:formylglycine-generating enzyme required for sulfatase activity
VVCVSWNDAQAYAKWLSGLTGKRYRLLSEAEWEYAARAGSATRYSFGEREQDLCNFANVLDLTAKAQYPYIGAKWTHADCTDGAVYTVPVARFKPNAFNLYGTHGNVWEWVQDCWHDDYNGAPAGQAAWEQGCNSEWRVRRGGGWRTMPNVARSSYRGRNTPDVRQDMLGFRLARDLGP